MAILFSISTILSSFASFVVANSKPLSIIPSSKQPHTTARNHRYSHNPNHHFVETISQRMKLQSSGRSSHSRRCDLLETLSLQSE
ncbi:uncharacterized protein G2W53_000647 [Senna tora]|uniref:Uncharacterized protein n=1 Tax=Senna tora TaxID=362788 RepID=A0A834XG88_9FABA|nr:uncharacterized protein G2W53_000647 [Senna tora]